MTNTSARIEGTPGPLLEAWRMANAAPTWCAVIVSALGCAGAWFLRASGFICALWVVALLAAGVGAFLRRSRELERWRLCYQQCRLPERLYEQGVKTSHGAPRVRSARSVRRNDALVHEFFVDSRWHSPKDIKSAAPHCAGLFGVSMAAVSTEEDGGQVIIRVLVETAHSD